MKIYFQSLIKTRNKMIFSSLVLSHLIEFLTSLNSIQYSIRVKTLERNLNFHSRLVKKVHFVDVEVVK